MNGALLRWLQERVAPSGDRREGAQAVLFRAFASHAPLPLPSFLVAASGVNTFYDSVCGLPLFRAPINRTFAEFQADTQEHGWPSFRPAEVVDENVVTDVKTGYVTSKCGTHLGSYLPDTQGPRWCMDLSCIAGASK